MVAEAIRAGKLKGIVHENKNLMVGQPPHPDEDVTLQDTSENIAKFIQSTDAIALFSQKMEPSIWPGPAIRHLYKHSVILSGAEKKRQLYLSLTRGVVEGPGANKQNVGIAA